MKDYIVAAANATHTIVERKITGYVIFDDFFNRNRVYSIVGTRSKSPRFVSWTIWKGVDDYWL